MFSWKYDIEVVLFLTCLDKPNLSQCLNKIEQVKYDSTLTVKCQALGNPDPDVRCELWDENNAMLRNLGKYYILHINCHKALLSKNRPCLSQVSFTLIWGILEHPSCERIITRQGKAWWDESPFIIKNLDIIGNAGKM